MGGRHHVKSSIVLGAGLQGVSVALALAKAGHRVTIVDRAPRALSRASLRNEGKIHLGFVYAHDETGRTASLMLDAALKFGPLMDEWLGVPVPWARLKSRPFSYGLLRDSIAPDEEVLTSWERLNDRYRHRAPGEHYLGEAPDHLWASVEPTSLLTERVRRVVRTAEVSIDTYAFRALVCARLETAADVRRLMDHEIVSVARTSHGFRVEGTRRDGTAWHESADTVVNCLWEGRLLLDRQMGLLPSRPWVYRLKYRVLGSLPPALLAMPSLTLMLGRFGDIVNYGDGRMYASWYPACLQGWSSDVQAPDSWLAASEDGADTAAHRTIVRETMTALDDIVPGFAQSTVSSVAAGVIFSWGRTDIDDLDSELHARHDIGPVAHDGYITVNTGKFTTAPLFARQVVEMVR